MALGRPGAAAFRLRRSQQGALAGRGAAGSAGRGAVWGRPAEGDAGAFRLTRVPWHSG